MLVHVTLEQRNLTCEQSWRRLCSSYARKTVASVAVLLQGKRKKTPTSNHISFLAQNFQSRRNIMFDCLALLYVWEIESSNVGM
jgi:hypothetical protein